MLIWYFGFTIFTWMNVFHACLQFKIYIFNSSVTRLSWHILCYLISINHYSLQIAQSFIFQFICMQLCKCLNCFLKTHNKQLNQYCLNSSFFFFFTKKKKGFKNGLGHESDCGSGWVDLQKTQAKSQVNPFLFSIKKKKIKFKSSPIRNSDPFSHVY